MPSNTLLSLPKQTLANNDVIKDNKGKQTSNDILILKSPSKAISQHRTSNLHVKRVTSNEGSLTSNEGSLLNSSKLVSTSHLLPRSKTTFDVLLPPLKERDLNAECRRATTGLIRSKQSKKRSLLTQKCDPKSESSSTISEEYLLLPLHVDVPVTLSCDVMDLRDINLSQTVDKRNVSIALTDISQSMYVPAISRLNKTLSKNTNAFLPHFIRGICHYHMNAYNLAKRDFSICCSMSKDRSERQEYDQALAFFNRSVVWMKLNDAIRAMEDINKAIDLYPFERSFFSNRAILYRRKGNFVAAQQDYKAIRRLDMKEIKDCNSSCVNARTWYDRISIVTTPKKRIGTKLLSPKSITNGQSSGRIRKTLLRRKTIHGGKSPANKKQRSLLYSDVKSSVYGQVHSALTCIPKERTKAQLEILVKESRMMSAFAHLDAKELTTLWKFLEYQSFPSNVRLFEKGDKAEDYMLVWSGSVSARVLRHGNLIEHSDNVAKALAMESEVTVNVMKAGETLGEAIMLEGGVRKASCVTEEPSEILLLKKEHFSKTFHVFLQKAHEEKVEFLSFLDFLSKWSREKVDELAHLCREKRYQRGETIIKQNDPANCFYFIKTGMLSVLRNSSSDSQKQPSSPMRSHTCVAKLTSSDVFGETTILSENEFPVFPMTVISDTLSICFRLDKNQLEQNQWDSKTKTLLAQRVLKFQDE